MVGHVSDWLVMRAGREPCVHTALHILTLKGPILDVFFMPRRRSEVATVHHALQCTLVKDTVMVNYPDNYSALMIHVLYEVLDNFLRA